MCLAKKKFLRYIQSPSGIILATNNFCIIKTVITMLKNFKQLLNQRPGLPKLPTRVKNLLLLFCSLLAGLLPLLLWLALILLWYYLPWQFSWDMRQITLALFLLAPFIAGFTNCRWRAGRYTLSAGAGPAFWLWLGLAAAYVWFFEQIPQAEKLLTTLVISLLLGIAGAMSAARISKFTKPKPQPPAAE